MYYFTSLVNNIFYFESMLAKFPKEDIDKIHFHLVNDSRYIPCIPQIQEVVKKYNLKATIYDGVTFLDYVNNNLNISEKGKKFLYEDPFTIKVCLFYYLFKHNPEINKLFYFDDDSYIFKSVFPYIDNNDYIFVREVSWGMHTIKDVDMLHFKKLFNFEAPIETFRNTLINSGHQIQSNKHLNLLEKGIENYFNNEHFQELSSKRKTRGFKCRAFVQEQRFYNSFMLKLQELGEKVTYAPTTFVKLHFSKFKHAEKMKIKKINYAVMHNVSGVSKNQWVEFFNKNVTDDILIKSRLNHKY